MIRALETALAGFSARSEDVSRLARKISTQTDDSTYAADMVGLTVNQRAAEANLTVARVAEQTSDCLLHVIA